MVYQCARDVETYSFRRVSLLTVLVLLGKLAETVKISYQIIGLKRTIVIQPKFKHQPTFSNAT